MAISLYTTTPSFVIVHFGAEELSMVRRADQKLVNLSKELIEYLQSKAVYRDTYEDVLRRLLGLPVLVRVKTPGRKPTALPEMSEAKE